MYCHNHGLPTCASKNVGMGHPFEAFTLLMDALNAATIRDDTEVTLGLGIAFFVFYFLKKFLPELRKTVCNSASTCYWLELRCKQVAQPSHYYSRMPSLMGAPSERHQPMATALVATNAIIATWGEQKKKINGPLMYGDSIIPIPLMNFLK